MASAMTGTYTIMTQIAAETLGLPLATVTTKLGDSSLSESPVEGGSWTAASVGCAVQKVCTEVAKRAFALARKVPASPLAEAKFKDVTFAKGRICLKTDPARAVKLRDDGRHAKQMAGIEPASGDTFRRRLAPTPAGGMA